jgi:DNA-binding PadR family transcriptional regulator
MTLTEEELGLLKELKAAGTRGRTITAGKPQDGLKRLVKAGYVTDRAGIDCTVYLITERGKEALATAA